MWVKNEKSWILGIDITSMQQSNDLCFTDLELVLTAAAQTYGGVSILNLHFSIRLCLSRIAADRQRGEFELVFSPIALFDNFFNVIVWVALPVSQFAI
jgi:hypothetical protein